MTPAVVVNRAHDGGPGLAWDRVEVRRVVPLTRPGEVLVYAKHTSGPLSALYRWWVVRREMGLAAGNAAGEAITNLYAALYDVPREAVAEAGRLRGLAAEVRDRGATANREGPKGAGRSYWPEVGRLLRESYRSLSATVTRTAPEDSRRASA